LSPPPVRGLQGSAPLHLEPTLCQVLAASTAGSWCLFSRAFLTGAFMLVSQRYAWSSFMTIACIVGQCLSVCVNRHPPPSSHAYSMPDASVFPRHEGASAFFAAGLESLAVGLVAAWYHTQARLPQTPTSGVLICAATLWIVLALLGAPWTARRYACPGRCRAFLQPLIHHCCYSSASAPSSHFRAYPLLYLPSWTGAWVVVLYLAFTLFGAPTLAYVR
jgi:hypothetical protein